MLAQDDALPIDALARGLGVTARHLRRVFTESVGVGPKRFARMLRLRRALDGMSACRSWVEVATSSGYYDQAHFIAEFRDLVGMTPRAFLAQGEPQSTSPVNVSSTRFSKSDGPSAISS